MSPKPALNLLLSDSHLLCLLANPQSLRFHPSPLTVRLLSNIPPSPIPGDITSQTLLCSSDGLSVLLLLASLVSTKDSYQDLAARQPHLTTTSFLILFLEIDFLR